MLHKDLQPLFALHERRWRDFRYVYPVISRRARGLSIGVNLNPNMACNFDCVYCQVDRTAPPAERRADLPTLRRELRHLVGNWRSLFSEPEFVRVPDDYRRLNDIAFSGDGEPTAVPEFPEAAGMAAEARAEFGVADAKIIIITDACFLTRAGVAETLRFLDGHNGEIWAKLDAGTEAYFRTVNRPSHSLQHVLDNILAAARERPVVIQSLFMRLNGEPPPAAEIEAYVNRLRDLRAGGGRLKLIQLYTVARRPAESFVTPLTPDELAAIAAQVRSLGVPIETY